jgi:hypothetical protein
MTYDYSKLILSLNNLSNRINALSTLSEIIPIDDEYHELIKILSESQRQAMDVVYKEALLLPEGENSLLRLPVSAS